jgi:hypothetical protein
MQSEHTPAQRRRLGTEPASKPRFRGFVFLVVGGLAAVATSLFTLFHLDDPHIVRATVPGFLLALGLFIAFFIRNRSDGSGTDVGGP